MGESYASAEMQSVYSIIAAEGDLALSESLLKKKEKQNQMLVDTEVAWRW